MYPVFNRLQKSSNISLKIDHENCRRSKIVIQRRTLGLRQFILLNLWHISIQEKSLGVVV